jgi:hypothetical protein
MSDSDNPLKVLARQNILDLASWLLGQEVLEAKEANIELTVDEPPRVDDIFDVKLADGRTCTLHFEFQGRRSRPAMPRRELNHLARLVLRNEWPFWLESFVIYVEKSAGRSDTGQYQINRLDGSPVISWNYTPILLWQESAETILTVGKPGIIPLVGLMRIEQPSKTLPQVVKTIRSEPDRVKQDSLFTLLLSLMRNEEYITMLERLIESEEILEEGPFLRRLRQRAEKETRRDDTLQVIVERFDPADDVYNEVESRLMQIDDLAQLHELFTAALRSPELNSFMVLLTDK